MLSKKRLYIHLLQSIISLEAAVSTPGTPSWFRVLCLKAMGIKVKDSIWVSENTWFVNPEKLTLGREVCIGEASRIICHAPISIGDQFLGAAGLYIDSGSHDVNTLLPSSAPITIGNRVWCGMRVTICAGVSIGDDVVIGAGSVVTKSLPSGYLAVGVPAKPIRKLERANIDTIMVS
jgi:maltose O-acetyltransferase